MITLSSSSLMRIGSDKIRFEGSTSFDIRRGSFEECTKYATKMAGRLLDESLGINHVEVRSRRFVYEIGLYSEVAAKIGIKITLDANDYGGIARTFRSDIAEESKVLAGYVGYKSRTDVYEAVRRPAFTIIGIREASDEACMTDIGVIGRKIIGGLSYPGNFLISFGINSDRGLGYELGVMPADFIAFTLVRKKPEFIASIHVKAYMTQLRTFDTERELETTFLNSLLHRSNWRRSTPPTEQEIRSITVTRENDLIGEVEGRSIDEARRMIKELSLDKLIRAESEPREI